MTKIHKTWAAGIAAIICLLGGWLLLRGRLSSAEDVSQVPKTVNAFFANVAAGKTHEAYLMASLGTRAGKTEDSFNSFLRGKHLHEFKRAVWSAPVLERGVANLDGSIELQSGFHIPLRLSLLTENGDWKISGIYINGPMPASPPPPNTPIPTSADMQTVVTHDLDLLRQAIVRQDFAALYATRASPLWQKETTADIMRTAFGAVRDDLVRDQKFRGTVAFTDQADFDENGYWNVYGQEPLGQDLLQFQLAYHWDKPEWKLVGVRVHVQLPSASPAVSSTTP